MKLVNRSRKSTLISLLIVGLTLSSVSSYVQGTDNKQEDNGS